MVSVLMTGFFIPLYAHIYDDYIRVIVLPINTQSTDAYALTTSTTQFFVTAPEHDSFPFDSH